MRNMLAECGMIARETRRRKDETPPLTRAEAEAENSEPDLLEAIEVIEQDDLDDRHLLETAWALTVQYRQKLLTTDISTSEYMNRYPCLRDMAGYRLVKQT